MFPTCLQFCDIFWSTKFVSLKIKSLTPFKIFFLTETAEFKSKKPITNSPVKHKLKEENVKPECKDLPKSEGGKVANILICMD